MKRHVSLLVSVLLVLAMMFTLASCELVEKWFPGNNPSEHTHEYVDGKCECGEMDPNYKAPHEHNFVEGKCECGESDPDYVAPHVHNFVDGKCECGESDPNYVKPECTEHSYGAPVVTKEATCTEKGEKTLTCTECGYEMKSEIAAKGHSGGTATCTEAAKCATCGESYGKAAGHKETAIEPVAATCEKDGATAGMKCSVCDTVTVAPEVIPGGHIGGTATCKAAAICTRCEQSYGEPADHSYVEIPGVAPTCAKPGMTAAKQCSVCEAYEDGAAPAVMPATGLHDYVDGKCSVCRGYSADYTGPKTYEFLISDVELIKDKAQITGSYANGFFNIIGKVTQRVKDGATAPYTIEVDKFNQGGIQFTVEGTATVTMNVHSTNSSNTSFFAIVDAEGNIIANNEGEYKVVGTGSGLTVTYTLEAGTYTVVSPDYRVPVLDEDGSHKVSEDGKPMYEKYPSDHAKWAGKEKEIDPVTKEETYCSRGFRVYTLVVVDTPIEKEPEPQKNFIDVQTTDTYILENEDDRYTFKADAEGKYTFTIPAGLGFFVVGADRPVADYYSESEATYVAELNAGDSFDYYVSATTKGAWQIVWTYEACEVEDKPEVEEPELTTTLTIGTNTVALDAATGDLTFVVTVADTYTFASNDLLINILDSTGMQIGRGSAYLTEGTYTISCWSPSGAGTYTITVSGSPAEEPEDLDITGTYVGLYNGIDMTIVITEDTITFSYVHPRTGMLVEVADAYTIVDGAVVFANLPGMYAITLDGDTVVGALFEGWDVTDITEGAPVDPDQPVQPEPEDPAGTMSNPHIWDTIPETATANGDASNLTHYSFTATANAILTITYPNANSWWNISDKTDGSLSTQGSKTDVITLTLLEGHEYILALGVWDIEESDLTVTLSCEATEVCEHEYERAWFGHPAIVNPTCCENGVAVYECIYCYDYYTEYLAPDPEAHDWFTLDAEVVVAPNCATGEAGIYKRTCAYCSATDEIEVDAYHKMVEDVVLATCTEDGSYYGKCSVCGYEESYVIPADDHWVFVGCGETGTCMNCGEEITMPGHDLTTYPATCDTAAMCSICYETVGEALGHDYVKGICSVCEDKDPAYVDYYLVGYINGADYGCEGDHQNLGEYKFVDGKLTVKFDSASYVFIKTGNLLGENVKWYLFETYHDASKIEGTLFENKSEKMWIPGGVEVIFTLTVNEDGSLTLSYHAHSYEAKVTEPTCTKTGYTTHTCACGATYTDSETPATGVHNYDKGTCTNCGAKDPDYVMSIPEVLASSEGDAVKVKGTVSEIYQGWDSYYKNISFYIVDESGNRLLVFRTGTLVEIGDQVTVTGKATLYNEVIQIAQGGVTVIDVKHVCSTFTEADCLNAPVCTICGKISGEALGHNYVGGSCDRCGAEEVSATVTVSATVKELITKYGWTNTTTKQSFTLDDNVSVKINGGSNTGKAYNGDHIRIYATDSPAGTITITVPTGYELVSVKISTQTGTYAYLYVDGTTSDICNKTVDVSGSSVVLKSVKNGSDGKQVRVTAIEVVYKPV